MHAVPEGLVVDGLADPLGVGHDAPRLGWQPWFGQVRAEIEVRDSSGDVAWHHEAPVDVSEVRYGGARLRSRMRYTWRVRLTNEAGHVTGWADGAFETGLLEAADWSASWIARAVPATTRQLRSLPSGTITWAKEGQVLSQSFEVDAELASVSMDIVLDRTRSKKARLELADSMGRILGSREVFYSNIPVDRFSQFIAPEQTARPGRYTVSLISEKGETGWSQGRATVVPDDGVSARPVTEHASLDGASIGSALAIGIEVASAPNPIFSKRFDAAHGIVRARLYATGLGYGAFYVNGFPITDAKLEPAQTTYDKAVLYRTYDVTTLLNEGPNEISAHLGRGFWGFRGSNVWGWNLAPWSKEPQLIAQLELIDSNGGVHRINSDDSWLTAAGPIRTERMYTGVDYELPHSDLHWERAVTVAAPGGALRTTPAPPVLADAHVVPTVLPSHQASTTTFDFGRILSGTVTTRISGGPGRVEFHYGEYLGPDGTAFCENILTAEPAQTDTVTLNQPLEEFEWEPEFSYKGFRYVTVRTWGDVRLRDLVAVPFVTAVASAGEFTCNDDTLNWIDCATARTFLNNLHGVPTDTPVYEKNGWTADAHLGTEAVLQHFDLRTVLTKWLDDHVDAQAVDGSVPQIIPTPGWGGALDPAWSSSVVLIPWNLYWEYGDVTLLSRYYESMRKYVDACLRTAAGDLWPGFSWGDWVVPHHDAAPEGAVPTASIMLVHAAAKLSQISQVLGDSASQEHYASAARDLSLRYNEAYYDAGSGTYGFLGAGYRQTMNVLALAFDVADAQQRTPTFESLVRDLEDRTGGHLDTGATGTKYLPPVLAQGGRPDLALDVVLQKTSPGWDVWRSSGDTLWETWGLDARSHNHYFLGSVAAWIRECASGVTQTAPGWSEFTFTLPTDLRLTSAHYEHHTTRGTVAATWKRTHDSWSVRLAVPWGSTATVHLPGRERLTIGPGDHAFESSLSFETRTPPAGAEVSLP